MHNNVFKKRNTSRMCTRPFAPPVIHDSSLWERKPK